MIVRIGVSDTRKELELDMADDAHDAVKADLEAAITAGAGVLWIADRHGRQVGVPADRSRMSTLASRIRAKDRVRRLSQRCERPQTSWIDGCSSSPARAA